MFGQMLELSRENGWYLFNESLYGNYHHIQFVDGHLVFTDDDSGETFPWSPTGRDLINQNWQSRDPSTF